MNDFEKEVFTEEELSKLNEKLKKHENIELPDGLKAENIEDRVKNDPISKANSPEMIKKEKKQARKVSVIAASIAAVLVVSVLATGFINREHLMNYFLEKNNPPIETQNIVVDPPIVPSATEYGEIEAMFLDYADKYERYYRDYLFLYDDEIIMEDGAIIEDAVGSGSNVNGDLNTNAPELPESGGGDKGDHGETNEQVLGVSEADIIKNDGSYLYVVDPENADWNTFYDTMEENLNEEDVELPELQYNCSVSIIAADSSGNMNRVGQVVVVPDSDSVYHMLIKEIYVSGNKLIVIAEAKIYDETTENAYENVWYGGYWSDSKTVAICYDITDKTAPTESWRVYQDGAYVSSRLINDRFVILSEYGVDLSEDEEEIVEECIPTIGYDADDCARVACDCIVVMEQIYDTTYLVASTLDIDDKQTLKTQAVLGAGDNVYCTTETLYATSNDYSETYSDGDFAIEIFGYDTIDTQIYKFDIRNYDMVYMGNATVEGTALNQFSIDEYNGYLRIATTSGSWGDSLTNQLYVLDSNLQTVGSIEGIARGESIRSVRFVGDTGYVVTFEQTDPLFVIDLSDPMNPVIKGELQIPGFSSYLHPVGDGLMLGVGFDGDDFGTNGGMKISLFDVSDPENPVECDRYVVSVDNDYDDTWSSVYCEAWYSHKALCWDSNNKIMYIPFSFSRSRYEGWRAINQYDGCVLALKVDTVNKKLVSVGEITHTLSEYDWVNGFVRVTYIGNAIYALSTDPHGLYAFNKSTGENISVLDLE